MLRTSRSRPWRGSARAPRWGTHRGQAAPRSRPLRARNLALALASGSTRTSGAKTPSITSLGGPERRGRIRWHLGGPPGAEGRPRSGPMYEGVVATPPALSPALHPNQRQLEEPGGDLVLPARAQGPTSRRRSQLGRARGRHPAVPGRLERPKASRHLGQDTRADRGRSQPPINFSNGTSAPPSISSPPLRPLKPRAHS